MQQCVLIFVMFFLFIRDVFAMQLPLRRHNASTIVKKIQMATGIETIACLACRARSCADEIPAVELITATGKSCVVSNISDEHVVLHVFSRSDYHPAQIDASPYKNRFVVNDLCYNLDTGKSVYFSKDEHANVLFSDRESLFFTVNNKSLVCYDSDGQKDYKGTCFASEIPLGLLFAYSSGELPLGVTFTNPSVKQSYFLCSNDTQTSMYRGTCGIASECCLVFNAQKLFDFCEPLDLTHWAYSKQLNMFYSITQTDRKLYVADIKIGKQTIWAHDNNFKIGSLTLYPDQQILVLLSQNKDRIRYIDGKNVQHILTTSHEVSPVDISNTSCGKILACATNDQLLLALNGQCLIIEPSSLIREFNAYEKYREIIRQLDIPRELQWLVAQWFIYSVVCSKKGLL